MTLDELKRICDRAGRTRSSVCREAIALRKAAGTYMKPLIAVAQAAEKVILDHPQDPAYAALVKAVADLYIALM